MNKTIVMKILEFNKIKYISHEYDAKIVDAVKVSEAINVKATQVFKTLVTIASDKHYYVFLIPAIANLDLKKCAKILKVKKVEMLHQKYLQPLTGYVHGGCSPLGQKKKFKTYVDLSAKDFETICFSGGKRGLSIETKPEVLNSLIDAEFADVVWEKNNEEI